MRTSDNCSVIGRSKPENVSSDWLRIATGLLDGVLQGIATQPVFPTRGFVDMLAHLG
jgi:hypothetical protein